MNEQAQRALARANYIRGHRAEVKRALSEGRTLLRDVDLDDPDLQSMKVDELLRALPWKAKPRKARNYAPTSARIAHRSVLFQMRLLSATPLASLSASRKAELKATVAELCPSQRGK